MEASRNLEGYQLPTYCFCKSESIPNNLLTSQGRHPTSSGRPTASPEE
jgi:hypothetical protein